MKNETEGMLLISGSLYGKILPVVSYVTNNDEEQSIQFYLVKTGYNSLLRVNPHDIILLGGSFK